MASLILYFATIQGLQFLLFQHKHTKWLRTWMRCHGEKLYFLSNCSFCQCFWLGILVSIFIFRLTNPLLIFAMAISAAIVGMVVSMAMAPVIKNYEENYYNPNK